MNAVVPGKWILAGEHSVLRGVPALVFPLSSRALHLQYDPQTNGSLDLQLAGEHGSELQMLFWGVIEKGCELKKVTRNDLSGKIAIQSSIPIGAGLGASAALCVAVAKLFEHWKLVTSDEVYEFARTLENLFHGESSGVDIAVALLNRGLHFERSGARQPLNIQWKPQWYVSYSGKRGVTAECVNKVKTLIQKNPELGAKIDSEMREAVLLCEQALAMPEEKGFPQLVKAINQAQQCFVQWGLVEGLPQQHMSWLKDSGAIAVKPTGSGDGGYVLSLWNSKPSDDVLQKLIPC